MVGRKKFETMVAKTEEDMKVILKSYKTYSEKKKLKQNVGKTNVMVFKMERKSKWRWGMKEIEMVKE